MNDQATSPRVQDVMSVGSRISWGAILAGAFLALAIHFLLTTLGGAVGLSISQRMDPANLHMTAICWAFITTLAALFVGGLVTSLFTVGEDKTEAVIYGIIMWAVFAAMLLAFGATGARSGFSAMVSMSHASPDGSIVTLETATRISWYAFAGSWLSMFAAAGGALVGAGPTFRLVNVRPTQPVVLS